MLEELSECKTEEERKAVKDKWEKVSEEQNKKIDYSQITETTELGVETDGTPVFADPTKVIEIKKETDIEYVKYKEAIEKGNKSDALGYGIAYLVDAGMELSDAIDIATAALGIAQPEIPAAYFGTKYLVKYGKEAAKVIGELIEGGTSDLKKLVGILEDEGGYIRLGKEQTKDLAKTGEKIEESAEVVKGSSNAGINIGRFTIQETSQLAATNAERLAAQEAAQAAKNTGWTDSAGNINWPKNDGFVGIPKNVTLQPGARIDRYGTESGYFVSPEGTPYSQRALAPGSESKAYTVYEIVKPIDALGGEISPWFDQVGGGIQFRFSSTIEELKAGGYIREVTAK